MIENKLRSLLNPIDNELLDQLPIYWETIKANDFHFLALICYDSEPLRVTLQSYIEQELQNKQITYQYYSQEEFLQIFEDDSFANNELMLVWLENPSDNWYLNLNIHRDFLIRQKKQVLLFCSPPVWELFNSKAPDFYSRLSLDFYFHDISVYDGEITQPDFSDVVKEIKEIKEKFEDLKKSSYPIEIKALNVLELANKSYQLSDYSLCLACAKYILDIIKPKRDKLFHAMGLHYRGLAHTGMGNLEQALKYHQDEGKLMKELENEQGLVASYVSQGNLLNNLGRLNEALIVFKKQEKLSNKLGDTDNIASTCNNQGLVLLKLGRLDEAFALLSKAESIWERLGEKKGLSNVYANKGLILGTWGKLEEAMGYHKKDEAICLEIGDREGLSISYGNQADILNNWGRYEQSLNLFKKKERICIETGNIKSLSECYAGMGHLLSYMERYEEAIEYNQKSLKIVRKTGDRFGLVVIIGLSIALLAKQGKYEENCVRRQII
jgi:tetratricopeptide (TPR) repeat protein